MTKTALVDPALGHSGGHHLAALIQIARELGNDLACVIGSVETNQVLTATLDSLDVTYKGAFSQPFYSLTDGSSFFAKVKYVARLRAEYVDAIGACEATSFLHHTLSWEHAQALSQAIKICQKKRIRADALHIVFATFNPGIDQDGHVIDSKEARRFRTGFRQLVKSQNVLLFASCSEYGQKYQKLLNLPSPLSIHPVFFDSEGRGMSVKDSEILYFGDAKIEKGFERLPDLIRSKLIEAPSMRYIVHYTKVEDPRLFESESKIIQLASFEDRVELITGYLSEAAVNTLLSRAKKLILDYDSNQYAQKTSGILWLATRRNIPVEVPANTWLSRETLKLSVYNDSINDAQKQSGLYREAVFRPFGVWLKSVTNRESD